MLVTRKSLFTGKVSSREIPIDEETLKRVDSRDDVIQNIVPHLSADDREFLMTGATPEEWDALVPPDDEEEELDDDEPAF
jgi:hypothetical protein